MNNITKENLERAVMYLNKIAGTPEKPWEQKDGKMVANIGCYFLDGAYGGYKIVQMVNESGGERSITQGYLPKRELYNLIHAYKDGFLACKIPDKPNFD